MRNGSSMRVKLKSMMNETILLRGVCQGGETIKRNQGLIIQGRGLGGVWSGGGEGEVGKGHAGTSGLPVTISVLAAVVVSRAFTSHDVLSELRVCVSCTRVCSSSQ